MSATVSVEFFTWMKQVTAANNGKKYYMIGQVKDVPSTVLVTLVNGNGGAMMFCQKHSHVYPIKSKCAECQNAPIEPEADNLVTTCDKPDFER